MEKLQVTRTKNEEELTETYLRTEEIYDGRILHVQKDYVKLPNGHESSRELIRHVGAVGIVPLTDDGQVVVERQFRYPINQVMTEIPAGKLDSLHEDRLSAAKRELKEETGLTADEWIELGLYYPACAYTDEKITLYLARGLHQGDQKLDDDEFLHIVKRPLGQLVDEVMAGEITDGKTQVGILKTARLLKLC